MKKLILFLLLASNSLTAQVTQEWVAKFKDSVYSEFRSITTDIYGNSYVSGYQLNQQINMSNYLTIKYNPSGILQWVRTYKGPDTIPQGGSDIVLKNISDNFGNIYVTGYSMNISPNEDIVTIKYNSDGDSIWVRRFNGKNNSPDYPKDMVIDKYSNVYITGVTRGATSDDYLTLKYDSSGNLLWNAVYTNGDVPNAIALDCSGNVYVTGESSSFFTEYLTVKYNSSGVLKWVRTHGSERDAEGTSIAVDKTGNIYLTGFITFSNGSSDYSTLKYDSSGNLLWRKDFERFYAKSPYKILIDSSSSCFVVGSSAILKYDSSGSLLWADTSSFYESIYSTLDKSGYLYTTRLLYSMNNLFFIKTTKYGSFGNKLWEKIYGEGIENDYNEPFGIAIDKNNNVFIAGIKYLNGIQNTDTILTIKYSQIVNISHTNQIINKDFELLQNYPNPFNPVTKIGYRISKKSFVTLKIYNVEGKRIISIIQKTQNAGSYLIEFNGNNLAGGIYFYSLVIDNKLVDTKKMLFIK